MGGQAGIASTGGEETLPGDELHPGRGTLPGAHGIKASGKPATHVGAGALASCQLTFSLIMHSMISFPRRSLQPSMTCTL